MNCNRINGKGCRPVVRCGRLSDGSRKRKDTATIGSYIENHPCRSCRGILDRHRHCGSRRIGDYQLSEIVEYTGGIVSGSSTTNITETDAGGTHSISGTIYEDVNGDAQSGDFSGRNSVTVRLFRDGGDGLANGADDIFVTSTLTAGGGAYSFTGLTDDTYWVVVDSKTITPSQGTAAPSSVWAEQTYAVTGGMDGAASFLSASGALYGGRDPNVSDNSTNAAGSLATSEHVTRVIVNGADASDIDSAFSFNVVTNVRGDNGDDDGGGTGRHSQGTLDQFIINANLITGANAMRFVPAVAPNVVTGTFSDDGNYTNDGGDDWWQINFTSGLPQISGANTTINGTAYSWLDGVTVADTNTGQVGTGGTVGVDGLTLNTIDKAELELAGGNLFNASALRVTGGNVTIQDLAINGFGNGITEEQIYIDSAVTDAAGAATITGNLIGTRADGTDAGTDEFVGIFTNGAANITNNYIAYIENNAVMMSLAWSGNPNLEHVQLINNEIAYNQFTPGFTGDMVSDVPTDAVIQGNYIHDFQGAVTLDARQGKGIEVWYQSQNVTIDNNTIENMQVAGIGINDGSNDNTISKNIITGTTGVGGSGGAGILITSFNDTAASAPTGNTITQNSIYGNAGLGIDLDARGPAFSATYVGDGITPNDAGDVDSGANGLQNFPVITLVTEGAGTVTIDGLLQTPAGGSYRIEFFASSAAGTNGYFEGERYIGSLDVTDGGANDADGLANGLIDFSAALAAVLAADEGITATATVDLGGGNFGSTSEFSGIGILIVDTTDDTVDGSVTSIDALIANRGADGRISLREALLATNATTNYGGPDHIYFDIPEALIAGAHTIAINSTGLGVLPTIVDAVVIDGTSEPDFAGTPIIELDGNLLSTVSTNHVLRIDVGGGGSAIRGLVINRSGADGIKIEVGADGNTIEGNYIGTNVAGNAALANDDDGIEVDSNNNVIRNNLISGNTDVGLLLHGGDGNLVVGNLIGTDAAGMVAISPANPGSARNGITIRNGADNNIIGGTTAAERNVISGNQDDGVFIASTAGAGNVILGNYIGVDITGAAALGNAGQGIEIQGGGNTIGGTAPGAGNVISSNGIEGILVTGASATGNLIQGNYIGVNATATLTLGNAEEGIQIMSGANGNTVGGSAPGAGNVISGNQRGVSLDGANNNIVQGNFIGTDASGMLDLGNAAMGVEVRGGATGSIVGGTNAGEGNIIAFNGTHGILVRDAGTGTQILQNEIYSNLSNGIQLDGNSDSVVIRGNWIGTDSGGAVLGNGQRGIYILGGGLASSSPNNVDIGGTAAGQGNTIAYNTGDGIEITGNFVDQIRMIGNSIYSNGGIGIDLVAGGDLASGVTPNDVLSPPDSDTGANALQNYPSWTATPSINGTTLTVSGRLDSTPTTYFTVHFYANSPGTLDPSGYGEGERYLGSYNVLTNASGVALFNNVNITVPGGSVSTGDRITMTATRTTVSWAAPVETSEFSPYSAATTASPISAVPAFFRPSV